MARNALLDLAKRLFSYVRRVSSHLDHKPSRWSNTGLLGEIQVTLRILIAARARTQSMDLSIYRVGTDTVQGLKSFMGMKRAARLS
ncbi:hypothetical protein CIK74_05410 [Glutamicibacter sp. BW77]|nr:hypothetical protein CIK74_05410 [Glutamicibacter sp. BW77]